ncbi:AcrR family transcriptional regulator [Microbacterium halimionae]|uniref:AcrR family transcriptional regulator n=1 Tax=Microbacterium halimionae TaxID=1526413 RepID=A0A7W3PKW7_9MICO|nr:TetR/AcrR family transcriptional regulator [Microbacterium halimionae]MBA8815563.1 AcrR family transcriptional regulator [Microbacterium halimionae]NII95609.1 AcrR family transcriptional regulator [Microbacterium halimionae]
MTPGVSTYHQQVAAEKRALILRAATDLFSELGYDKTSLARVAERAGVSTATMFKQFPTKADLFEAIVLQFWAADPGAGMSPPELGDPRVALQTLGHRYAQLLHRPGMAGLHRMVIAEAPRFPELGRVQFDLGKEPFFELVRDYVESEATGGRLRVPDGVRATTEFLGMISNFVLWPQLLLQEWSPTDRAIAETVESAVETFLARYMTRDGDSR